MKLYNYDKQGIFTKITDANIDPLETDKQGKDIFLIPARATDKKSPAVGAGEIAIFDGSSWTKKLDIRGIYYNKATKERMKINELNSDVSKLTLKEPTEYENYCAFINNDWKINETEKATLTAEREREDLISIRQAEIVRRQAISELETEGKI